MTARAMARMYAALLGEVDGIRLLSPERLREVTTLATTGNDELLGFPATWTLGYSTGAPGPRMENVRTLFGVGGVGGSLAYMETPRVGSGLRWPRTGSPRTSRPPTGSPRSSRRLSPRASQRSA